MSLVVADASALVDYLFGSARGSAIASVLETPDVSMHVPGLCDVEVAAVVGRALNARRLDERRGSEAMLDYMDLPIERHGHAALLGRVLRLRANFTAYDAVYVALAEQLNAAFVTTDNALARAVRARTAVTVI